MFDVDKRQKIVFTAGLHRLRGVASLSIFAEHAELQSIMLPFKPLE